ncbi:MAG: hypothetical protein R3F02_04330 [Thiolinea sp.]
MKKIIFLLALPYLLSNFSFAAINCPDITQLKYKHSNEYNIPTQKALELQQKYDYLSAIELFGGEKHYQTPPPDSKYYP